MRKTPRCSIFLLIMIFFLVCSVSSATSSQHTSMEGWYFLPAYHNYAPQGLPDFGQKQDNWKGTQGIWRFIGGLWSFCGPTCLADIFWWFDSKHENPTGYPGDGNDSYPLVRTYNTLEGPVPGPNADDHNYNNVNDNRTPWKHGRGAKEFIETLAWYCNTNYCRNPFIRGYAGTYSKNLEKGARQWIQDAGLQDHYAVESVWNPEFSLLVSRLQNNCGIIVNFLFYNPDAILFQTFPGHYAAVAGIHPNGSIALSDPYQNIVNPTPTPSDHNDANIVSYDIFPVNLTSPFPEKASWWIEQYFYFNFKTVGGLGQYALIISEQTS